MIGVPLLSAVLLLATLVPLAGQARGSMTGTVLDDLNGRPIGGAVVEVVDTSLRAETDGEGNFILPDLPVGTLTLRIGGPGYTTVVEQVDVQATTLVHFEARLTPMEAILQGLLVTGRAPTGRTSSEVRGRSDRNVMTAADLLAAEVPGLTITSGGGNVGAGSDIRIRGISTIRGPTAPLIYLDGIRITDRSSGPEIGGGVGGAHVLQMISADDVERIEVLRGPAASGRYGDSANGVILIETVRGNEGGENDDD